MTATERTDALIAKLDSNVEKAQAAYAADPGVVNGCMVTTAKNARWYTLHTLVLYVDQLFPGHDARGAAQRCDELRAELMG